MHLEAWPLIHGAEFTGPDSTAVLYEGQTLIVNVTLRNLWRETVQFSTASNRWESALRIVPLDEDGQPLAVRLLGPRSDARPARTLNSGDVQYDGSSAYTFGPSSEQQVQLRFAPSLPEGTYRIRVELDLQVVPSRGEATKQSLTTTAPLAVVSPVSRAQRLETLYREATLARVEGRLFDARSNLTALVTLSPNSTAALILLGDVAVKQGDRASARKYYDSARGILEADRDPDSVQARGRGRDQRLQNVVRKLEEIGP
jgi:hypothetical protein